MDNLKFIACEFLDFEDNYTAKKEIINHNNSKKICWNRPTIDNSYPSLVQFCKKRGRLNNPTSCLCNKDKACNDYKDFNHNVSLTND